MGQGTNFCGQGAAPFKNSLAGALLCSHVGCPYVCQSIHLSIVCTLYFDIQVNGKRGPGRPKMTWKQLAEWDRREWKLSAIDPHDRDTWRSGLRSAMRAASQLPGRGPTVVDMAPISVC